MFAILKLTPSNIAWQGVAMPGLELRQEVLRLLRRGCCGSDRFRCLGPFDEPGGGGASPLSRGKGGQEGPEGQDEEDPPVRHGDRDPLRA